MKDYILSQPSPVIRYEASLAVGSMEILSDGVVPFAVEAMNDTGIVLQATWRHETGGYLNIQEFTDGKVIRELGLRGVASTLWPEIHDGPRNITGVVSFTPQPRFTDILKKVKEVKPKHVQSEASRLLCRLLVINAKEMHKSS